MSNPGEAPNFSFHPDLSLAAELAGLELSGMVAAWAATAAGRDLTGDERLMISDLLAPGLAHFHDLAAEAGQLAGEGDIVGAFSLLGGERRARELIGDAEVDGLLAELAAQGAGLTPEQFDQPL